MKALKVTVLGAGNFGTVVAKLVAENASRNLRFNSTVQLWTHQEILAGGNLLSDVINHSHENKIYLPGILLPRNIVAEPDLKVAVSQSDVLVFVVSSC